MLILALRLGLAAVLSAAAALAAPTPRCQPSQLVASLAGAGVGLGNVQAHVYLRNTSNRACFVRGYLGFALETRRHRIQPSRVVRGETYFERDPGPRDIVLRPRARAVADLAWTGVPAPGEPQRGPCEPASAWLVVVPPGRAVSFGASVCDHGRMRTTALTEAAVR